MAKILFTLVLPEPEIRKKQAPPARAHKNRHAYSRKRKHKKAADADGLSPGAPDCSGAFSFRALAAWPGKMGFPKGFTQGLCPRPLRPHRACVRDRRQ